LSWQLYNQRSIEDEQGHILQEMRERVRERATCSKSIKKIWSSKTSWTSDDKSGVHHLTSDNGLLESLVSAGGPSMVKNLLFQFVSMREGVRDEQKEKEGMDLSYGGSIPVKKNLNLEKSLSARAEEEESSDPFRFVGR
jgi:hypothetical protein